eukprot:TRINITY_DN5578_c0_g1_i1.p1 TRINITY_DN5578_c0_g1~~TRINITY_DN5578_c0_g1_i1.p1  ORF type:complete len:232 (+),score=12.34 TRINITY_DN5578_c0_g1_i1:12-707(+)
MDFTPLPLHVVSLVLSQVPVEFHAIVRLVCTSFRSALPRGRVITGNDLCIFLQRKGLHDCLAYVLFSGCHYTCALDWASANNRGDYIRFDWDRHHSVPAARAAAAIGDLGLLQYMHRDGLELNTPGLTLSAAKHLPCLRYLHEHGCPWDEDTCKQAAFHGSIASLRYAHEHGCPWDIYTPRAAVYSDNMEEIINYALDNGCPVEMVLVMEVAYYKPEKLKYLKNMRRIRMI